MKIIAITGGSGSGKTTIAAALQAKLRCPLIAEDDYYQDNASSPNFDASQFNFDHIEARDHDLLDQHLSELKSGKTIAKPNYCFKTHNRLGDTTPLSPGNFLILEGIHILCNPAVRSHFDFSVYLDVPDDIRLSRRLLRDVQERGRTTHSVIQQYLTTVRPAHEQFTLPSKTHADHIISPDFRAINCPSTQSIELQKQVSDILNYCQRFE